ncbi:MAG TPA: DNA ligase D [Aestuariivirgaceae bacterium]|jgi:bifunctional non-homologous end joining protein LigD
MAKRSLSTYKAKRDFSKTPEPRIGGARRGNSFVVQHHWATREHYDFRLELDGVLLSWAVTRGPSFNPADKRLAVRTEDHPLSYADFEGVIPEGNYGAGTVMLWDRGTWEPNEDPRRGLKEGSLKFTLHGDRLKGNWALVLMKGKERRENWLLIKERDAFAAKEPLIETFSASVSTGRSKAEIEKGKPPRKAQRRKAPPRPVRKTPAKALPLFVSPMMCELHKRPPPGEGWLHETKLDGYRLEAALHAQSVRLYTREGLDWTARFPTVAEHLARLGFRKTLFDGEAVVFDQAGLTDFAALVQALKDKRGEISYVVFDILMRNGKDLRGLPLSRRKQELEETLREADGRAIRLSSFIEADGPLVFEKAAALGAEGIVSKRTSSFYESRRSPNWVKTKTARREDFIIIGYKPSERRQFSSLLAASETSEGLKFVGGVGTGFGSEELEKTYDKLNALKRSSRPPVRRLDKAPRKSRWVEPVMRAEVEFQGWTSDGQLRQARFLGWREDRTQGIETMTGAKAKGKAASAKNVTKPRRSQALPPVPSSITHPERIIFPKPRFTKGDSASYYLAVADRILPHLQDRPISFVRAPEGLKGETFFQRHQLPGMSAGIRRVPDPEGEHKDFIALHGADGLTTAAQFGVIELHGWGARLPKLNNPDRVVLDLDPDPAVKFAAVRDAAFELRELLRGIELESFPLITGGKGVHVIIPLDASQGWDEITDFASGIARGLAEADPERFIATASKEKRKRKIYIDWLRNRLTASAILPWSLRAKPNASVAVPVSWTELKKLESADEFTLETAPRRKDPWLSDFFRTRQRIDPNVLDYLRGKGRTPRK